MISLSGKTAGEWSKIMNAIKHISRYATAKVEHDEVIVWALSFTETDFIKAKIHNLDVEGEKEGLFCFDAETLHGYFKKYPPQEKIFLEIAEDLSLIHI